MASTDLKWLLLNDFSPGIRHRTLFQGSTTSPSPAPGVATEDNTYRCIALPGGGLGPLPKRVEDYQRSSNLEATEPTHGHYYVSGFYVAGPLSPSNAGTGTEEFHVAYEWVNPAGTDRKYKWERVRRFDGTGGGAGLDAIKDLSSNNASLLADQWNPTLFATTRGHNTTPSDPGFPIVVAAWHDPQGGGILRFVSAFPTPTVAGAPTNTEFDISTTIPAHILVHQARIVLLGVTAYNHGSPGSWSTNEDLYWTVVNDPDTFSSATASVFVPENPSGYGAFLPMSANELLLIKQAGGGLTINGDLDDPTVINLPNITPTGTFLTIPTHSPVGVVYGSALGGVWAWSGGDTSVKLSNYLEDDFFDLLLKASVTQGNRARFERWYDWVLTSNNWLYDTVSESWWRIEDPDDIQIMWWSGHPLGVGMFGAIPEFSNASPEHIYRWYRSTPSSSYSWQSHPIWESVEREIQVRQVVLIAQGTGTITVTLTGVSGTQSKAFALSSNTPVMLRENFGLRSQNVQVRIESAHTSTGAAPIVNQLKIGYDDRARVGV